MVSVKFQCVVFSVVLMEVESEWKKAGGIKVCGNSSLQMGCV